MITGGEGERGCFGFDTQYVYICVCTQPTFFNFDIAIVVLKIVFLLTPIHYSSLFSLAHPLKRSLTRHTVEFVLFNEEFPSGKPKFASGTFASKIAVLETVFELFPSVPCLNIEEYSGKFEILVNSVATNSEETISDDTLRRVSLGNNFRVSIRRVRYVWNFKVKSFSMEYSRKWIGEQCQEKGIAGSITRTSPFELEGQFICHSATALFDFTRLVAAEVESKGGVFHFDECPADFVAMDYHFIHHKSTHVRNDGVKSWGNDETSVKSFNMSIVSGG